MISEQLRKKRAKLGLSVSDMSYMIGISKAMLYRWENGVATPSDSNLKKILKILNLNDEEFKRVTHKCAHPDCERPNVKNGLCALHYENQNHVANYRHLKDEKNIHEHTVGGRIKALRTRVGLSRQLFGYQLGVTRDTIVAWENDYLRPSLAMMIEIANFFHIEVRFLEKGTKGEKIHENM